MFQFAQDQNRLFRQHQCISCYQSYPDQGWSTLHRYQRAG